jgi:NADH-quinone oxidoreductase subunit N
MLFSLAGMPFTAGFLAKFYVVATGASVAMWPQIIVLVVTSGIGVYYYLRVVLAVFSGAEEEAGRVLPSLTPGAGIVLGVLTVALVWLGVFPGPMLSLIGATVRF